MSSIRLLLIVTNKLLMSYTNYLSYSLHLYRFARSFVSIVAPPHPSTMSSRYQVRSHDDKLGLLRIVLLYSLTTCSKVTSPDASRVLAHTPFDYVVVVVVVVAITLFDRTTMTSTATFCIGFPHTPAYFHTQAHPQKLHTNVLFILCLCCIATLNLKISSSTGTEILYVTQVKVIESIPQIKQIILLRTMHASFFTSQPSSFSIMKYHSLHTCFSFLLFAMLPQQIP